MSKDGLTQLILENKYKNQGGEKNFKPDARIYSADSNNNSNQVLEKIVTDEKKRGYEQGYKEAIERAKGEWEQKLNYLTTILTALEKPLQGLDQDIQDKTLEIAIAIAKQIIRRELAIDSGQIVSAVKQAIELIPKDGQAINIYVNPNDEGHIKHLFAQDGDLSKFNIIQDPTISLGGCRASTDYSLVDLTIEKQVAMIAAQIFGEQRKSNN